MAHMHRHAHAPSLDLVGASASTLCAIHCAAMPLIITALPTLGIAWVGSGAVEWGLVATSGFIAFLALRKGHRIHGREAPRLLALMGFLAVVFSILLESMGGWITVLRVLGGLAMVFGHILNALACREGALRGSPNT